jgi:hypothetical protein
MKKKLLRISWFDINEMYKDKRMKDRRNRSIMGHLVKRCSLNKLKEELRDE